MSKKTLAEFATGKAKAQTLSDRLASERAAAVRREQIAELNRLTKAENHRQDALRIIRDMAVMIEPPKMLAGPKPQKGAPLHVKSLVTSDWQMGQHSKLGASGGIYEQTSAITRRQLAQMWETLEWRHRIQMHGKRFDEFVMFNLGDLCEGDQMRVSQAAEIDNLVTKQALDVLDMEAMLLTRALKLFKKVTDLRVGGNHDRTSSKPGNAGLGELGFTDTFSWLVGEFLKRMFERVIDAGRLEIVNHESFFGTAYVAGLRCVYEHGASFKTSTGSYGGVPYYPIANAARGYKEMLDGADIVLMGHHHKGMVLPMNGGWGWQIVNGALPPSSSWIQAGFKGYGRPVQIELEFHEQKGLTDWAPIYLEQPEHGRPGNYWKRQKA